MAALGDAIMASAALCLLKRGLPDRPVAVLARVQAAAYFRSLPFVDEVVPFVAEQHIDRRRPWRLLGAAPELLRLLRRLRSARYGATVQWRGQIQDTLLSRATGAPHRVAAVQSIHRRALLAVERVPWLVTDLVPFDRADGHLVEAMAAPAAALVRKLGGDPAAAGAGLPLHFPLTAADRAAADEFLAAAGLDARTPFACLTVGARSEFNDWPPDRFAAVADYLAERHGLRVILNGMPSHAERELHVARTMRTQPVRSVGRLSFGALAAVLARSRLLVALNTGIVHVAAALRVPVVVLNGRDGASITPWGTATRIVTRNPHYPRRHPDPRQWAGLVGLITAAEVNAAVDSLLASSHAG
jgi:ADP-heptose:LPS heptosyltransferase